MRVFRNPQKEGEGILIVSLHLLGDSVYTIPAIRHIVRDFTEERISILCYSTGARIYKEFFSNTNIQTVTKSQFIFNRFAKSSVRMIVKRLNPRLIIDMTGAITSASSVFLSGNILAGINIPYYKKIYDYFTPLRSTPHLMDMYFDSVQLMLKNPRDESLNEFDCQVKAIDKIFIFPFAGWKAKEWDLSNFIEIAKWLQQYYNVEFIAEPNQFPPETEKQLLSEGFRIRYSHSLDELFELMKECSLFISNDSGPVHIAQALGRVVFIIYGPTNPDYSIPFGSHFDYIRKVIPCSPFHEQFCHTFAGQYCKTLECMVDLKTESVKLKLEILLSRYERIHESNKTV